MIKSTPNKLVHRSIEIPNFGWLQVSAEIVVDWPENIFRPRLDQDMLLCTAEWIEKKNYDAKGFVTEDFVQSIEAIHITHQDMKSIPLPYSAPFLPKFSDSNFAVLSIGESLIPHAGTLKQAMKEISEFVLKVDATGIFDFHGSVSEVVELAGLPRLSVTASFPDLSEGLQFLDADASLAVPILFDVFEEIPGLHSISSDDTEYWCFISHFNGPQGDVWGIEDGTDKIDINRIDLQNKLKEIEGKLLGMLKS